MKKITVMILALFSISAFSQTNQEYDLKWIVDGDNPIAYKTAMEPIDTSDLSAKGIDCGSFLNTFSDSSDFDCDDFKDFFAEINNYYRNYTFITTLTESSPEVFDVKLISQKNDSQTNLKDSIPEFFKEAMTGVQLRGKINKSGSIASFYTKKEQKNLLALLFELPSTPVRIGDKWSIEASLLSMDHNFICHDFEDRNVVELLEVKVINDKEIAVLKYDIYGFVKGDFNNPFFGKATETTMEVFFNGISEFNITDGKWHDYNGLMSITASGIMNSDTKQRFKLIEIEEMPEEILNSN